MPDTELSPEEQDLARRLVEARTASKVTQEQVADALNIPRSAVSAIEAGKRRVTGVELKRFARLYRRPISEFIGEAEVPEDPTAKKNVALFRRYGRLDEDQQQLVEQMITQLERASHRRRNKPGHSELGDTEPPTTPSTTRS